MSKLAAIGQAILIVLAASVWTGLDFAHAATNETPSDDQMLGRYFAEQTDEIAAASSSGLCHNLADWEAGRPELRRQLAEMLGLDPLPSRTPLNPVITGKLDRETFTVEKLYFQSRPHLYVTANLYVPKNLTGPAPTVLYLCGHSPVISNGISYGNKVAYQHHGEWFASNGYVCLILDTVQWGEILGHHWGTYSEGKWWWNSRGYTPAGVETWDAIRAIDYLLTRPEVDKGRIGVTGRSGGGAYSWFVTALDDRIKVAIPAAGITDLRNHVVDGTVDGHCDCMFFVNTYRWDYPMLAALCAPRPLLLENTDADSLFPLNGVLRTRNAVKRIYDLYGAGTNFGMVITPGPHHDTQELQVPAFRWFNSHLKHDGSPINCETGKLFSPAELKVFDKIPEDQINRTIAESFVPAAATPEIPATAAAWQQLRDNWMRELREKCFAGWPAKAPPPAIGQLISTTGDNIPYEVCEIQSQPDVVLQMYIFRKRGHGRPKKLVLRVADSLEANIFDAPEGVERLAAEIGKGDIAYAVIFPRGLDWKRDKENRRRFMLLGQTLDGMRVWDIRRAIEALRSSKGFQRVPLTLQADGNMGINALYATLFEPDVKTLDLHNLPTTHMDGPDYLNVLKYLDIPEAAAMAAEHCQCRLQFKNNGGLDFLKAMESSPVAHLKLELIK